jgi:glycosyltransferase involved in cell wall biosynthesis
MPALVSVCIPTLGRPLSLARCLNAVAANTDWPYEVITEWDSFDNRQGCPRTLAKAVARSRGEYVAFIGNDCLPQPGWLRAAMECMAKTFSDGVGMVGFNDLVWPAPRCLHFVISKAMLPFLDGEIFHTGYSHVGCDDELIARCRQARKYVWCADAVVEHHHFSEGAPFDRVYAEAWKEEVVARDRTLLAERAERMGFSPWLPK